MKWMLWGEIIIDGEVVLSGDLQGDVALHSEQLVLGGLKVEQYLTESDDPTAKPSRTISMILFFFCFGICFCKKGTGDRVLTGNMRP